MEIQLYKFQTSALEERGQSHAVAALLNLQPEKDSRCTYIFDMRVGEQRHFGGSSITDNNL